jgi:hypothetical protein
MKTILFELDASERLTFAWCPSGGYKQITTGTSLYRKTKEESVEVIFAKGFWMSIISITNGQFQELLNGFYFIYETKKDGDVDFFPYSFDVMWYDDRVNYSWIIKTDGSNLTINIFELSTSDSNYKKELLNETIGLQKLFNDIYYSLDTMLREFGLIGYKTNW